MSITLRKMKTARYTIEFGGGSVQLERTPTLQEVISSFDANKTIEQRSGILFPLEETKEFARYGFRHDGIWFDICVSNATKEESQNFRHRTKEMLVGHRIP